MTYSKKASSYIGIKEGSAKFKNIIDYYNNNITPLPRGYRVKYTDSWCAVFVSVVMKLCNAINAPYECSVSKMWNKAKSAGMIVTSPAVNDFIVYDWNNDGTLNHVGIISEITSKSYKVIEGNYSDSVKTRTISKTSKEIYGFFRVPRKTSNKKITSSNLDNVVNDVIAGKYGNGKDRKIALEKAGYNYSKIQALVNIKLGE